MADQPDGIKEFKDWCDSLSPEELAEMADQVDDVMARAVAGINATEGFEPFLLDYLPKTEGAFMAPLFNVAQKVQ